MKWSISKSKMFRECQRKWYYYEIMASHGKKDHSRREVFLLKQLQSVYAWRGSLVDTVIETLIVPKIGFNNFPSEQEVIDYSMQLVERQLEFGKAKKHLCQDITKSSAGYCAFYEIAYNGGLKEEEIDKAKEDIRNALTNLMRSDLISEFRREKPYLVAQRKITLDFNGTTISCTPDLIAFYRDRPPKIVDWKVHTFGNTQYWLQLGVYGFVLSKTKPHNDFSRYLSEHPADPTGFDLVEYQLLNNTQRRYTLSQQDLIDIEDYIFQSITQMNRLLGEKKYGEIEVNKFQTAYSPDSCKKCQFKHVCWRGGLNDIY